ncbi:MAG: response regulator [Steroidobacteraceae bacterium]
MTPFTNQLSTRRPAVAVIDDEPGVRKGLSRLLRAAEFDPRSYASAQEFFDSWELQPPDCVVVDLQMPGASGMEVQMRLKCAGARFPVIVVTAHDEPEAHRRCLALGAVAYLCKPLDGEELLEAIQAALSRRPC